MFSKKPRAVVRNVFSSARQAPANVHLRNDIGCGMLGCLSCSQSVHAGYEPALLPTVPVMIPDTNVILHNINALEDSRVTNIILLGTVLSETMNRNKAVYARLQRLIADPEKHCFVFPNDRHEQTYCPPIIAAPPTTPVVATTAVGSASPPDVQAASLNVESPNDYQDRCIRVAAMWLGRHLEKLLQAGMQPKDVTGEESQDKKQQRSFVVALVSHDRKLREIFQSELDAVAAEGGAEVHAKGLKCLTLREYISEVVNPECDLLEKLQFVVPSEMKEGPSGGRLFETHLPFSAMEQGVQDGIFFKGKLRVSDTNCFFGEIRGKFGSDPITYDRILIPGRRNLNRSIHDDVVCLQLLPVSDWKSPQRKSSVAQDVPINEVQAIAAGWSPCGKVVGILEPRRRAYCGSIDQLDVERAAGMSGQVTALVQPKNGRIPKIRIQTSSIDDLKDKRLAVVIDDWSEYAAFPSGHYIEVIGNIGDKDTEAIVILKEHDIPHYDFSASVYDCLPKGEWHVEASELRKRLDLRDLCIVSVDPLGCRDIDDALHCRIVNGNHYEVGVHIADVTHFLAEHCAMDVEAAKRCTSVYLVDRRINMLPQLLTENLCSIVGGEERYAFSIIWEFDENFNIVRDWFGKTVIKSRAALYYGDAQKMIDNENDHSEIAVSLKHLMKISKHFKACREKEGALFLASQEFKFKVDNDHVNPTDMVTYQSFEANSMIEEWMLYANAAAAKKIYSIYPQWTLLRRHQKPSEGAFDSLNEALTKKCGVTLDDSCSLSLNRSLDLCEDPKDPFFNKLVRILTTRCLKQAQYFSSGEVSYDEFAHFGLAMPIYTHFTSPIRRYADVVVHRQLAAAIGIMQVSDDHTNSEKMNAIAGTINYRHEQAQKAGRDSQNLFTGFYLRNFVDGKIPLEDGYVVRISDTHVSVLVPRYGQEARIAREAMTEPLPGLLDKVRIRITVKQQGDVLNTKLEFHILTPAEEQEECASLTSPVNAVEPPVKRARVEA